MISNLLGNWEYLGEYPVNGVTILPILLNNAVVRVKFAGTFKDSWIFTGWIHRIVIFPDNSNGIIETPRQLMRDWNVLIWEKELSNNYYLRVHPADWLEYLDIVIRVEALEASASQPTVIGGVSAI